MTTRQTTGFVESLLRLVGLDWTVLDFSTLSRRQKTLAVTCRGSQGPLNLLIDNEASTGRPLRRHRFEPDGRRSEDDAEWHQGRG